MRIQKGDTVIVTKGSDRKKTGEVLRVIRDTERVVVAGVNVRTIHRKPRTRDESGSIEKKELPISISNVAIVDPKTKQPTRISYVGTGKEKRRVTRKSGTTLRVAVPVKPKHRTGVMTKKAAGAGGATAGVPAGGMTHGATAGSSAAAGGANGAGAAVPAGVGGATASRTKTGSPTIRTTTGTTAPAPDTAPSTPVPDTDTAK